MEVKCKTEGSVTFHFLFMITKTRHHRHLASISQPCPSPGTRQHTVTITPAINYYLGDTKHTLKCVSTSILVYIIRVCLGTAVSS